MTIDKEIYVTTGEFAKICKTTKHRLFHYDDIGLFSPEIKDEKGYRYYSISQVEPFFVIVTLKEMGLSLNEIKNYLKIKNPEELIYLLEQQRDYIENKIDGMISMKNAIEGKIKTTKSLIKAQDNIPKIVEYENHKDYIITEIKSPYEGKNSAIGLSNHIENCMKNNIYTPHSIGQMIEFSEINNKNYNNYKYFCTKISGNKVYSNTYRRHRGKYLVKYHLEGYSNINKSYLEILEYGEKNNLNFSGYFFEDTILDELSVDGYDNFIIKISIRIDIE